MKRKLMTVFFGFASLVSCYCVNSILGGYGIYPNPSKKYVHRSGLRIPSSIDWYPYFGYDGKLGKNSLSEAIQAPFIWADRRYWHKSKDIADDDFEDWLSKIEIEKIHPADRGAFLEIDGESLKNSK
ncbi:MAG: hypothetical protein JNK37_21230 [Verrucomicrobiales bacterium]|nr:hypothetical protein [Verrucomicrobiales bacterium]